MSTPYMHAVYKIPLYIYFLYGFFSLMGLLSRRAPSSGSPLAMPPFGGAMASLRSGCRGEPLSRGSPGPPPPVRPQRASTQGLRLRFAQLSAPKGLCPVRLRFHRQALVLARTSLRSIAAMESPPCGHGFAA